MRWTLVCVGLLLAGCIGQNAGDELDADGGDETSAANEDSLKRIAAGRLAVDAPGGGDAWEFQVDGNVSQVVLRQVDNPNFQWVGSVRVALDAPSGSQEVLIDATGAVGSFGSLAVDGRSCVGCALSMPGEEGTWAIVFEADGWLTMPFEDYVASP